MNRQSLFTLIAAGCIVFVVLIEIGSYFGLSASPPDAGEVTAAQMGPNVSNDDLQAAKASGKFDSIGETEDPPGLAIPLLALIDIFLMLTFGSLALSLVVPHRIMARITAPVNLVVSIIVVIVGVISFIVTLILLFLMIGLLLAVPFGTITYFVRWGFFPRGSAQAVLGVLLMLKLAFAVAALLASPRMLKNKGIVAMVLTSIIVQLIVGFLHVLVPSPLTSITDAIAALIVIVAAVIWAVIVLVGSLIGTLRLFQVKLG